MKNSRNNKGFSLVELIVVIAVMAVLVGVLAPAYLRYVDKSKLQKDISAIGEVEEAIKVAAAEVDVAEEIPESGKGQYAYVEIASNGSITAYQKNAAGGMEDATALQKEVRETVGTSITFSNEVLLQQGVLLRAVRDEDYNVIVKAETYRYDAYEEVKEAIVKAFGSFRDTDKIIDDAVNKVINDISNLLNNEYGGIDALSKTAWTEAFRGWPTIRAFSSEVSALANAAYEANKEDLQDEYADNQAFYKSVLEDAGVNSTVVDILDKVGIL